ncbi:MAG TPA: multiheme c-type cytochrome [Candidatus Eisenbacteria bacterium]|nr:multiheme c-type cytochrome [Candidatus Eisenbacteria bacterium]
MSKVSWMFVAALVLGASTAQAQTAAADGPMYVGVKRCKTCHNLEKAGGQYAKWTESKHSKAFEVLASPKALEIAKEKGIADPQKADECLSCHVTGHGEPAEKFKPSFLATDGVGCESCHGAGSNYIKNATMKGIRDKSLKAEDHGLLMPTKKTCDKCHNEKATGGQSVDWPADSLKIAHPIPADFKRGADAPAAGE